MTIVRPWRGLRIVMVFASIVSAQRAADSALVTTSPKPVQPVSPPERTISPHLAELMAASMPKYQPVREPTEPVAPADPEGEKPSNEIVRLPRYVVSGSKLPTSMQVLTKKGLEHYAMEHYLGPEDGLDRGFLNLFTIGALWKKIPVLGSFPFVTSETNEDRAMRLYETAERKREMDDLTGLIHLAKEIESPPAPKK